VNKFATISPIARFTEAKVKIYTVQIEEDGENRPLKEFEDWIQRHRLNPSVQDEFKSIRNWIQVISEGRHDLKRLLRPEAAAHALPPRTKFLKTQYSEQLRLYAMVIGRKTLILFNGGIKTAATAQDCPNVARFFHEANQLSNGIERALRERILDVDYDSGTINNPEKTEIDL